MTTESNTNTVPTSVCPKCSREMRREHDGLRVPPMPHVFWFCTNSDCDDGRNNRLYSGG